MITILAFFRVSNDLYLGREDFENLSDQEAFEKLYEMQSELDVRFFDMSTKSYGHPRGQYGFLNADEFETDYNDEVYDGGWWVRVMILDEIFVNQVILKFG